jgi:hypothetical protein
MQHWISLGALTHSKENGFSVRAESSSVPDDELDVSCAELEGCPVAAADPGGPDKEANNLREQS